MVGTRDPASASAERRGLNPTPWWSRPGAEVRRWHGPGVHRLRAGPARIRGSHRVSERQPATRPPGLVSAEYPPVMKIGAVSTRPAVCSNDDPNAMEFSLRYGGFEPNGCPTSASKHFAIRRHCRTRCRRLCRIHWERDGRFRPFDTQFGLFAELAGNDENDDDDRRDDPTGYTQERPPKPCPAPRQNHR